MISERQLAKNYSSFWRDITPLGETFWRAQHSHVQQIWESLKSKSDRFSRAFINELAFEAFSQAGQIGKMNDLDILRIQAENGIETTKAYISRFQDSNTDSYQIEKDDISEAVFLATRLGEYFSSTVISDEIIFRPGFAGCGELMAAEGDLMVGQTLYEIKAGDRPFRISDLRQVLTYCALNRLKPVSDINEIALLNPRVGLLWIHNLETCCLAISGKSSSELFDDIADYVCQSRNYL